MNESHKYKMQMYLFYQMVRIVTSATYGVNAVSRLTTSLYLTSFYNLSDVYDFHSHHHPHKAALSVYIFHTELYLRSF